ncbi:MAG: hypothetical protein LBD34_01365 [Puniceicoccales bacterium]|nr:hypothetical protein [Puniceicoccales bacterium]
MADKKNETTMGRMMINQVLKNNDGAREKKESIQLLSGYTGISSPNPRICNMIGQVHQPMLLYNMSAQVHKTRDKQWQAANFFATYLVSPYPCTNKEMLHTMVSKPIKFCKLFAAQQDIKSTNNRNCLPWQAKLNIPLWGMERSFFKESLRSNINVLPTNINATMLASIRIHCLIDTCIITLRPE